MGDPKRLLSPGTHATPRERRILSGAADVDAELSASAREAMWGAIVAQTAVASSVAGAAILKGSSAGATAAKGGTIGGGGILAGAKTAAVVSTLKLAGAIVMAGGAALSAAHLVPPAQEAKPAPSWGAGGRTPVVAAPSSPLASGMPITPPRPNETVPEASPTAARVSAAAAAPVTAAPGRTVVGAARRTGSVPSIASAPPRAAFAPSSSPERAASDALRSPLAEESEALVRARAALRAGDARAALVELDAMASRFAGGVLAQEREVLTIEALAGTGERGRAATRAEGFLRVYPASPHVARVQEIVVDE